MDAATHWQQVLAWQGPRQGQAASAEQLRRCSGSARVSQQQLRTAHRSGARARRRQTLAASADAAAPDPLAAPGELPLWGRRILVTAPRQYAGRLAAPLAAAGARVVAMPCITIQCLEAADQLQELDAALFSLDSFQHIAFTSRNAIAGTLARLAALHSAVGRSTAAAADPTSNSSGRAPDDARDRKAERTGSDSGSSAVGTGGGSGGSGRGVDGGTGSGGGGAVDFGGKAAAALGSCGAALWALGADAGALLDAGIEDVQVPVESSTQGLVAALAQRGVGGQRVLCLVPHVAPPLVEPPVVPRFLAALERAGAVPVRAPAYVTSIGLPPTECLMERDMLERGAISAIAFSSQAEAQGLLQAVGGDAAGLAATLRAKHVLLAAHGPYTAAGVAETLGHPVDCVSRDFSSFDGLVAALSRHYQQQT